MIDHKSSPTKPISMAKQRQSRKICPLAHWLGQSELVSRYHHLNRRQFSQTRITSITFEESFQQNLIILLGKSITDGSTLQCPITSMFELRSSYQSYRRHYNSSEFLEKNTWVCVREAYPDHCERLSLPPWLLEFNCFLSEGHNASISPQIIFPWPEPAGMTSFLAVSLPDSCRIFPDKTGEFLSVPIGSYRFQKVPSEDRPEFSEKIRQESGGKEPVGTGENRHRNRRNRAGFLRFRPLDWWTSVCQCAE